MNQNEKLKDGKSRKRVEAEARAAEYAKLTTQQKLARPDLGKKEAAKLAIKLKEENANGKS